MRTIKNINRHNTNTVTINQNKMILSSFRPSGDNEKVAFVMPREMIEELLDVFNHFNSGMSMPIGRRICGTLAKEKGLKAIWYHYGRDEFGEVEQIKTPIEYIHFEGSFTGEGIFANITIDTVNKRTFTLQYNVDLFRQGSTVREITRELLNHRHM